MKFNGKIFGIIIVALLGVLIFKQGNAIERSDQLQAATTRSVTALTSALSATEERLARKNTAHHASLAANLEELKSMQSAGKWGQGKWGQCANLDKMPGKWGQCANLDKMPVKSPFSKHHREKPAFRKAALPSSFPD